MCAEEGVGRASGEGGAGGRSLLEGVIAVSAEEVGTRGYHPRFAPAFAAAFEYLVLGCLSPYTAIRRMPSSPCPAPGKGEGTILKALNVDEFCSALAQHCMLT